MADVYNKYEIVIGVLFVIAGVLSAFAAWFKGARWWSLVPLIFFGGIGALILSVSLSDKQEDDEISGEKS